MVQTGEAGEASQVRSTPFEDVGTVLSGPGLEMVWVSKLAEPIGEGWFPAAEVDLILPAGGHAAHARRSSLLPITGLGPREGEPTADSPPARRIAIDWNGCTVRGMCGRLSHPPQRGMRERVVALGHRQL